MKESQSKNNCIYIALAVLLLIAMLAWAYMSGRRDGAEHNVNRTNRNANATQ